MFFFNLSTRRAGAATKCWANLASVTAPMLSAVAFAAASTASTDCAKLLDNQAVVFGDMSDGDEKLVTIAGTTLKIDPWANKQKWTISAPLGADCSALVNVRTPAALSQRPLFMR